MVVEALCWTQGVWNTSIGSRDGHLARDQVTTREETEGREEGAEVVAEAIRLLATIRGLRKGGDSVAGDIAVVGLFILRQFPAPHGSFIASSP